MICTPSPFTSLMTPLILSRKGNTILKCQMINAAVLLSGEGLVGEGDKFLALFAFWSGGAPGSIGGREMQGEGTEEQRRRMTPHRGRVGLFWFWCQGIDWINPSSLS